MKPYGMLQIPAILLGFAGALILAPTCKAQEVSPDHFTDTGVADVYQPAQQVVAPKPRQTPPALQARNQRTNSPASATTQLASNRDSSAPAQPSAVAISDKRKVAASPRKQQKP